MQLPDDDELYEIDGTYLGPPGRYIGNMRYRAIGAFLVIAPLSMVIIRRIGLPLDVLPVGLWFAGSVFLANVIADNLSRDQSAVTLARTLLNDLLAPRAVHHRSFSAVGSTFRQSTTPRGAWARALARRTRTKGRSPFGQSVRTSSMQPREMQHEASSQFEAGRQGRQAEGHQVAS